MDKVRAHAYNRTMRDIVMGKKVASRGRGVGNASPVTGQEAEADIATRSNVRCCETPEFFAEHGCPHGRVRGSRRVADGGGGGR